MEKNFFAKREEEIIEFWERTEAFKKSIENRDENNQYVFYDGPPFATGLPHYGHILASTMKDIVPRFWTMRGKRVERRWGWDCHGLPIENIVEKEIGLNSRKDIEELGVTKFNECCETKIGLYADEWQKTIRRLGRWVDMENDYRTMDLDFMESVWWVFKSLYEKDLVYEGQKSMHICPRCETTLSNIEVSQGYQDVIDISATAKFELLDEPGTYVLAWTTTPWTLPGNVALAIGVDILYAKVKTPEGNYMLAADLCSRVFGDAPYEVIKTLSAKDLVGRKYRPLFDFFIDKELANKENLYTIVEGDFVSIDDGTGVVHIAPAFGEDDLCLGREKNLPFIQHVGTDGRFLPEVTFWAGLEVKPRDGAQATDKLVVDYLKEQDLIFVSEEYRHSYPHCWRCDSPLLNYTTSSWFVNVTTLKDKMLELAQDIHWSPEHLKAGRFGQWLEGARDWSISRSRYWGNPIPIWRCDKCRHLQVVGSVAELRELSGMEVHDIHKHHVDERTWSCSECDGTMRRIPQVFDCWFESGSMPYGQMHYPMDNQKKFEANFPAEFIAEGVDQTRAWFYVLHVLSTALFGKPAYKNVVVNGIVLAEDGQKMSKKKKNYPDPMIVIDKYGADALRYYLATSPVMRAEDLCFTEKGVDEVYKKVILITLNVLNFYEMFRGESTEKVKSENILDRWILAKLHALIREVTERMNDYDLSRALKPIGDFINELSTWYVRRSRDRFKSEVEAERLAAIATLGEVLEKLALLLAPFTPFIAEHLWLKLGNKASVHLEDWPGFDESLIDVVLLSDMERTRAVVELGLSARDERKIKVRQPLSVLYYQTKKMSPEMEAIVAEELNVLAVEHRPAVAHDEFLVIKENGEMKVALNYFIDDKLKLAGLVRETVRQVNNLRRNAKLTIQDQVTLYYETSGENLQKLFASEESVNDLARSVLAKAVVAGRHDLPPEFTAEAEIDGETVWFGVEK